MSSRSYLRFREELALQAGVVSNCQGAWTSSRRGPAPMHPVMSAAYRKAQVLLVEDDPKLANSVRAGIEADGYTVTLARTAEEGLLRIIERPFRVILLDIMLPGMNGLQLLRDIRARKIDTPVLILTARDTVDDRVLGLDYGADDYLGKPFALPELLARIRARARREEPEEIASLECADLQIDVSTHTVRRAGTTLSLTLREFEILQYLCRNQGRVISREMLARDIWRETSRHTPLDNVIDVHIARLRRKVDGDFEPKLLHTVRGVGFILRDNP